MREGDATGMKQKRENRRCAQRPHDSHRAQSAGASLARPGFLERNAISSLALIAFCVLPARAAIEGVVINGTTGRQQSGVEVTLVKLEQGMTPLASTKSDAAGRFRFDQDAGGRPTPLLLRGEFEGVTYNQMIPPGSRTGDVRLTVYKSAAANGRAGAPEQHVVLFEPSGRQMIVNEFFLYRNQSQPPVTYTGSERGTLRFFLPPDAKGIVQVSATGPGGMPIRSRAEKTGQPDIYKVNFPIKPGESRIELTYLVPYQSPADFEVRNLYDGLTTRIAAPGGVTISGEGLEPMPENPQIKASIFSAPDAPSVRVSIAGEGRLSREQEQGGDSSGDSITIVPPPIQKQLWLILGFVLGILALGFYGLYSASGGPAFPAPAAPRQPRNKRGA
jgi:hypothetical protein